MKRNRRRAPRRDIQVTGLRATTASGVSRISAEVDGAELFFESSDVELSVSPQVFASALLPVAVRRRQRLRIDEALERRWRSGVADSMSVWADWWQTEPKLSRVLVTPRRAARGNSGPSAAGVGLCFSLGVDSFHTLLRAGRRVDYLILAEGYDIPLGDRVRVESAQAALREVAAGTGTQPALVRTNLRVHPTLKRMGWQHTHGGALAALGHACHGQISELLISATKPFVADRPWGSHWSTDPGYSSSRLTVTHVGAELRRNDKLAAVIREPLVRRHLRVCWENRAASGNCGECEKCVRTMLITSVVGDGGPLPAFPNGVPLARRIDRIQRIRSDSVPVYLRALEQGPDDAVHAAVERLLARSGERVLA